jgi:MerR family transcriptional regulator/heat shock protein HspR
MTNTAVTGLRLQQQNVTGSRDIISGLKMNKDYLSNGGDRVRMRQRLSDEPCYVISVVARLTNLHPQTLRHYERLGLIKPARSSGNQRLYSEDDVERLRQITRLTEAAGVNLAGVEIILQMREEMRRMEETMDRMQDELEAEIKRLQQRLERARATDKVSP